MEIITTKINQTVIELHFVQDLELEVDELTPLVSSLVKIEKTINKTGFSNKFTKNERALWNNIFDQILPKMERNEAPKD